MEADEAAAHSEPGRPAAGSAESTSPLTLAVGAIAWEMAEWEIHQLRGLAGTIKSLVITHVRQHKKDMHSAIPIDACEELSYLVQTAWQHFEDNRRRALADPAYRRGELELTATECPPKRVG